MRAGPPVFIAGPARSGTTLLRWIVDTHPRLVARSEQNWLQPIVAAFKKELLTEPIGDELDAAKVSRLSTTFGVRTPIDDIVRRFRTLHESFYLDLCRETGKVRWADGTHAVNDYLLPAIDVLYEQSPIYFILVRHGLDTAVSLSEKFSQSLAESLKYWTTVTDLQLAFAGAHADRCVVIRYEDLVADAQAVSDRLFSFAGEDPVPDVASRMFSTDHGPAFGDHKILQAGAVHARSVGRWHTVDERVRRIAIESTPHFAATLRRAGYEWIEPAPALSQGTDRPAAG
jgi:hypothetical protein